MGIKDEWEKIFEKVKYESEQLADNPITRRLIGLTSIALNKTRMQEAFHEHTI
jgi:hypothetical protein